MEREHYQEEDYKGYDIFIDVDEDAQDPRDWDNIGKMVCFHRDYKLGDKHTFYDADSFLQWLEDNKKEIAVCLPLFLYDHSGLRMSTSTANMVDVQWDVSRVGVIYVTKETVIKEYGKAGKPCTASMKKKAREYLIGEVETYDQYLSGQVYGYSVDERAGGDSCWGYYGNDGIKQALEEARASIDAHIKEQAEKKTKKLKAYIKNHVPIEKRTLNV